MIWLVTRLVVLPVKATAGGFKLGFWTGRLVGWRRLFVLGLGVGVGLLVAPGPGAELRARLREKLDGGRPVPVATPPRPPTPTVAVPANPSRTSAGAPTTARSSTSSSVAATGPAASPPGLVLGEPAGITVSVPTDVATVGGDVPLPAAPDADPVVDATRST